MRKTVTIPVILLSIFVWLTAVSAAAATYFSDGVYTFEKTENGTAIITDCSLTENEIRVPGSVLGYPVIGIGNYAFMSNSYVGSVTLPDSVISIGKFAFAKNSGLRSVTIHSRCENIADNAFFNSPNVTIYCYYGTAAHTYAAEKHIPCVLLDGITLGNDNGDSYISIGDVTAIQRHIAELDTLEGISLLAADINSDGAIEIDDATALQMYIAGFESPYPIGEPIRLDNTIE